jgi:hypothetical protein
VELLGIIFSALFLVLLLAALIIPQIQERRDRDKD